MTTGYGKLDLTANAPLVADVRSKRAAVFVLGVPLLCLLTAVGAHVRVPVPGSDVPMTLQMLAVLIAGLTLPPRYAASAMGLYLACGATGLPVFAPGSTGLFGGTGGYLVGFLVAAPLVSILGCRAQSGVGRMLIAAGSGAAVVLTMGVLWKVAWLGGDVAMAVTTGLLPFVGKAFLEVGVAVSAVLVGRRTWEASKRFRMGHQRTAPPGGTDE